MIAYRVLGRRCAVLVMLAGTVMLSACAGGPDGAGGLGLVGSCKDLKRQLGTYEARGVHLRADAAGRGAKLSAKQRVDVARYNGLLNSYLSNKCHV